MQKEQTHTQADMEKTLSLSIEYQRERLNGTINQMLKPRFVSCDAENKTAIFAFEAQDWMANPMHTLHGGIIATAIDLALGTSAYYWANKHYPPVMSLTVNFMRPGRIDGEFMIRSQVLVHGKTAIHVTGEVWNAGAAEKPIASATGVYYNPSGRISTLAKKERP